MEEIQLRIYGDVALPVLVYLPGLHGDWTLVTGFRAALRERVRFVEITYPRTLTWTMADYAEAIETALRSHGITHGWLLGESFGSQPAWAIIGNNLPSDTGGAAEEKPPRFQVDGLILAGGFVKHPAKHGPSLLRWIGQKTPMKLFRWMLGIHRAYARLWHRLAPETLAGLDEFVARRTELDRQAMRHRLALMDEYDPRSVARRTRVPVRYLDGLVDPLVPWPLVRRWLRNNCPGYRGGKTILLADHNVLATAPARAAAIVLRWMSVVPPPDRR